MENYPVAEKYFFEFMEDLEMNLGPQHAYTIEIRRELASFWDLLGAVKMGFENGVGIQKNGNNCCIF